MGGSVIGVARSAAFGACGILVASVAIAQDVTDAVPTPLIGLFAGGASRTARSDTCRIETMEQFRLRVLPTGRIRWWSHTYSGLTCSDGAGIPTSCSWSGIGTLRSVSGRTATGVLALDISDVGSAPPLIETHLRQWRCGAITRILPDSIQRPPGCVLLGTVETEWSHTVSEIAERSCRDGQPFTDMEHLTLRAERAGRYHLMMGRTVLMTLGRIEESPDEAAAAELEAEQTIRVNRCRAAREHVYDLLEEFYNGEGFRLQPINAANDQSGYCRRQYQNGFQWGPEPVDVRWLNRCTAEFSSAENDVRNYCVCSDWPNRGPRMLCSPEARVGAVSNPAGTPDAGTPLPSAPPQQGISRPWWEQ